jgi:Spy/CpxP family protein refolding chaperone
MNGHDAIRPRRLHLLAIVTLLVVFAAGALVGAAVERGTGHHRPPHGAIPRTGGPPPMFAEGSPLVERLKLTPAQRDSIEKLTAGDRARADSVFHSTRQLMRAHFDSTIRAVDAVLTPEQRVEWKRIHEQWHATEGADAPMRHHGAPGGHGPGPGKRGPGGPPPGH